jgi:hypothetical protein
VQTAWQQPDGTYALLDCERTTEGLELAVRARGGAGCGQGVFRLAARPRDCGSAMRCVDYNLTPVHGKEPKRVVPVTRCSEAALTVGVIVAWLAQHVNASTS